MDEMRVAALAVLLLVGCASGGDPATVGVGGGASVGGMSGAAGAGGMSTGGTGGAVFTSADAAICWDWPVCPDGIISPAPANPRTYQVSTFCPFVTGAGTIRCSWCVDIHNGCAPFVGRCKAPFVIFDTGGLWDPAAFQGQCSEFHRVGSVNQSASVLCTGAVNPTDGPSDAKTVCGP